MERASFATLFRKEQYLSSCLPYGVRGVRLVFTSQASSISLGEQLAKPSNRIALQIKQSRGGLGERDNPRSFGVPVSGSVQQANLDELMLLVDLLPSNIRQALLERQDLAQVRHLFCASAFLVLAICMAHA